MLSPGRVMHRSSIRLAMIALLLLSVIITAFSLKAAFVHASGPSITVNKNIQYQQIDGFGGFGVKLPSWTDGPYYDDAFGNTVINDLGLTILRDGLSSSYSPTPGSFDINNAGGQTACDEKSIPANQIFAYLNDLKSKAAAAGQPLKLILSVWSPPKWMKYVQCVFGTDHDWNRLIVSEIPSAENPNDEKQAYADYLVKVLQAYHQNGIDPYAISIQNEPAFGETYQSAVYSPEVLTNTIKVVVQDFKQNGITTKIFMPEDVTDFNRISSFVQWAENDPVARQYVDILAVHGYGADGVTGAGSQSFWTSTHKLAAQYNLPLWMTETSGYTPDWTGAMSLAGSIYTALKYGQVNAWVYWALSDNGGSYSLMNNGNPQPEYYASKQFYRYIRPGAVMVDANSDDPDVLATAFNHVQNKTLTEVLINQNTTTAKTLNLNFVGNNIPAQFTVIRSSSTENAVTVGTINSTDQITLPPNSIVTLYGSYSGQDALQAPSILTQPQSASVSEGNSVTFSVQATGSPSLQYQWNLNGNPIAGATGSIYTFSTTASSAGQYTVTVTNGQGSVTSNAATLSVGAFAGSNSATASTAPTIDGNSNDAVWSTAPSYTLGHTTGSPNGLSASYQSAYDSNNLYLLVKVNDPTYANGSDNVEVYLDGANYKIPNAYIETDWQYIFTWGNTKVAQYRGGTSGNDVAGHYIGNIQFAQVANSSGNGYQVEIQIPWSTLNITPTAGQDIGFDIDVAQQSTPGTTNGKIFWNATTDDDWHDPSLFGVLKVGGSSSGGTPTPTPTPTATPTPTPTPVTTPTPTPTPTSTPTPTPTPNPGGLPAPWQSQDIGSVGIAGSASYNNGTFTVAGSGSDIWGSQDAFRFAYQPLSGDGTIVAEVTGVQSTDYWAKAGVMIRQSLTADSVHAFEPITSANGAVFQDRTSAGGNSNNTWGPSVSAPYWIKLVRSGNTFTGSVSSDGSNWTQVGSDTIAMSGTVYIGLAVTAHNNSVLNTSTFTNVSVTGGGSSTPTPTPTPTNTPTPTPTPVNTPTPTPTSTPVTSGNLLANDPFNGNTGAINGVSTGSGWGGSWTEQLGDTSVPGYDIASGSPLSYSTLAASGNYAIGGLGYQTLGRELNVTSSGPFSAYLNSNGLIGQSGTTLWVSFLLRKDADTDQENSVSLHDRSIPWYDGGATSLIGAGYFGSASNTNGTRYWSLKIGSTVYQTSTPVTVGQTALLVLRIDFGSTTTASLYANPGNLGGNAPATASVQGTSTSITGIQSLGYYGGDGTNQSSLDEIRFGTSYAAVTPTH